jgi:exodeoxyribonuclease V alpha subunit
VHGGVKFYRGAAKAPYVERDRSRADDYYLAEGAGVATRITARPGGPVRDAGSMTGETYEKWVAGIDLATGRKKGRIREDANALRFVEVTVNGPKTWSLAAALHPEISAALDKAQDHAASEIVAWVAAHATTRVGPRGRQVQVPVEGIEAAVIRHYPSRAGDPHRHLHLQINAGVYAAGAWRGIHSVAVRDSIEAINGIGHGAVAAGQEGIRLHDLRHFYASGLIAAGCDVVTVQRALGHAKASTTLETYSHLWPSAEDKTRKAAATLAQEVLALPRARPGQQGLIRRLNSAFTH